MSLFEFSSSALRADPSGFNRQKCCAGWLCAADFLDLLIAGYNTIHRSNWENCLNAKWSITDCVSGCHNHDCLTEIPEHKKRFLRNSHQYCVASDAIKKAADIISKHDFSDEECRSFDSFFDAINSLIADINGIGPLVVYDTALRMGWNRAGKSLIPEENVYLHSGALWGAQALKRISELSGKDYIKPTADVGGHKFRIPLDNFCSELKELGPNHLENFLCVCHKPLEWWADALEKEKNENKKKTKTNN